MTKKAPNYEEQQSLSPDVILAIDLLKVGDNGDKASLKKDMEEILFKLNEFIERDIENLINIFMPSVCKQPIKAPIYAAFVSIVKDRYPHFAKLIVNKTHQLFQIALNSFDCFTSRVILRFIGELTIAQVIETQSYYTTIQQLSNEVLACLPLYQRWNTTMNTNKPTDNNNSNNNNSSSNNSSNNHHLDTSTSNTDHHQSSSSSSSNPPTTNNNHSLEMIYIKKARSDFLLSIILDCVPFIGKELLSSNLKSPFIDLLHSIDRLISMRSTFTHHDSLLNVFPFAEKGYIDGINDSWYRLIISFTSDSIIDQNAYRDNDDHILRSLLTNSAYVGNRNWIDNVDQWERMETLILRPPIDDFPNYYTPTPPVPIPAITIPPHREGFMYERRMKYAFRLFDKSKVEGNSLITLAATRIIIDQYILDLITTFNNSHRDVITNVSNLPFDVNFEYYFLEMILGQMLRRDKGENEFGLIYYAVLLLDFCKMNPKFANNVSSAILLLFSKLGDISIDSFDRLTEWFALHLSNCSWKWDWSTWSFSSPSFNPADYPSILHTSSSSSSSSSSSTSKALILQHQWIADLVEQMVRLSYYDRIKNILPSSYHSYLPPLPTCNYAYQDISDHHHHHHHSNPSINNNISDLHRHHQSANAENIPHAKTLIGQLLGKVDASEISAFLDSLFLSHDDKLAFFFQGYLKAGEKTTLHNMNLRGSIYRSLMISLTYKRDHKLYLLSIIHSFWANCAQKIIITIDSFLGLNVLDPISVISWCFAPSSRSFLSSAWIWTVLRNTIKKAVRGYRTMLRKRNKLINASITDQYLTQTTSSDSEKEIDNLSKQIDDVTHDLKLLFTSFLQEYSNALDDTQQFDINTMNSNDKMIVYRLYGHLEEFALTYAGEIKMLIEDDFHKNYSLNSMMREILSKIKSFY